MTIATDKWNLPKPETNEFHTLANFNTLLDAIDAAVFSVTPMTEVQRDALAGTKLWTGRVVYNTTSARSEVYNGAAWVPISDLAAHIAAGDPHPQYLTGAEGVAAFDAIGAAAAATAAATAALAAVKSFAYHEKWRD